MECLENLPPNPKKNFNGLKNLRTELAGIYFVLIYNIMQKF